MTVRTEDVVGGLATAIDAIKPEPGEFLVLRVEHQPTPESMVPLQEWLKKHLADVPALVVVPGAAVTTMTPEEMGLKLWGSECLECGNATHASQRCELCDSVTTTVPLWMKAQ